jgi:hypothetical protein
MVPEKPRSRNGERDESQHAPLLWRPLNTGFTRHRLLRPLRVLTSPGLLFLCRIIIAHFLSGIDPKVSSRGRHARPVLWPRGQPSAIDPSPDALIYRDPRGWTTLVIPAARRSPPGGRATGSGRWADVPVWVQDERRSVTRASFVEQLLAEVPEAALVRR